MSSPLQTVHVRVNDAATGQPTPVRIRFTDSEGTYYAPFGRLTSFATGSNQDVGSNLLLDGKAFAYIDGTCEIGLPAGAIQVTIHKGPEFWPLEETVTLAAGKLSLRFAMKRWIDLRQQGWYSGDCRAHYLSPFVALLEGEAEDLAVVQLLARHDVGDGLPTISNLEAFSGQEPALATPGCLVVVNTLNSHPVLGSLGLLHCHRIVFPLRFGGSEGTEDWTLADWCDQCHRKQGLVIWTGLRQQAGPVEFGEPLADLVLGKIDAFEIEEADISGRLLAWYDLLNVGINVALAGSSGKECNLCALGALRIYARLSPGEQLSCKTWIEAVRAGRTFITNGPLLSFEVNGHGPGTTIDMGSTSTGVAVKAEARSTAPFDALEVIRDGEIIASAEPTGMPYFASLQIQSPIGDSQWLAARCLGGQAFAHTSPVKISVAGRPFCMRQQALKELIEALQYMTVWVESKARCDDRQRNRLGRIFRDALEILEKRQLAR